VLASTILAAATVAAVGAIAATTTAGHGLISSRGCISKQ
jgi:hypothetical protein